MANYQINMIRGDTLSFNLEFTGLNQDLTTADFTVKEYEDGDIIFQKKLGAGITKQDSSHYCVRIAPADTQALVPKNYHFDLEITINGDVFTIMIGILVLEEDVTYYTERS